MPYKCNVLYGSPVLSIVFRYLSASGQSQLALLRHDHSLRVMQHRDEMAGAATEHEQVPYEMRIAHA